MTPATAATAATSPFRCFTVRVARLHRLSPTFLRVTFTGEDLDRFAANGDDQRIKLVLPLPGAGLAGFPSGSDWYPRWRALPEHERHPVRTYTVRAVRRHAAEVDVDVVLHGDAGPASRWARAAATGDEVVLVGPNADHTGGHGGVEWRPPAGARLLLAGDETAVPAITSILEGLPDSATGDAFCEVPDARDVLDVRLPAGIHLTWLVRGTGAVGSRLGPAVEAAVPPAPPASEAAADASDEGADEGADDLPWEVPDDTTPPGRPGTYAWLAGEAGAITRLRRSLVTTRGVPRESIAFMGYWKQGRSATS